MDMASTLLYAMDMAYAHSTGKPPQMNGSIVPLSLHPGHVLPELESTQYTMNGASPAGVEPWMPVK